MPWFKVDDNLAFHAKAVAAGNPAMGLWVRAGSWCAQQLTDGFLPDHMLPALGTAQQAKRLVDNRLWERVQGGYRFHEWTERQPSKGDVEAERAAARERMREFRARKKGTAQTSSPQVSGSRSPEPTPNDSVRSDEVRETFGNPDPTRPDPTRPDPNKEKPRKRATAIADDFRPNEANVQLAVAEGVDLRREFEKFCDYNRAKGNVYKDWHLALNNWIRKAAEYGGNVRPLRPQEDPQGRLVLPPLPGNEWSGR
jgi:hypothetical protein